MCPFINLILFIIDLIPDDFTAEGLIEEFKKQNITGKTIGIPRTASARAVLPEELEKLGNTPFVAKNVIDLKKAFLVTAGTEI